MTNKEAFVVKYYPFAKQIQNDFGIPASVTLSQSGLETGWNSSTPGNMMFGVKAGKNYTGKKQLLTTHEYTRNLALAKKQYPKVISAVKQSDGRYYLTVKDWFVAYDSPYDSFRNYARLITGTHYSGWQSFSNRPDLVARHIASKGYATAPNYGNIVASLTGEIETIIKKKILEQA
jgi:flagellar protein FlgJ